MKLLYAARIARFDLLRSINSLARNVTKWTVEDDAKLYHLMYVNSSLSKRMVGWVGDTFDELSLSLFADADFAGCSKPWSHMHIQGGHTRFPLSGGSKRQGCLSHSTPEAEIVAADVTLRTMGLPALSIWETLTGKSPKLVFHDDNQGMIGVVRSGKNPTMRHLERIHGISITSMHEHFKRCNYVLMHEVTSKMAADIHTKGFKNPLAWKGACMLINLLDPGDLSTKGLSDMVKPTTDVDTTVRQVFQSRTNEVPNFPYTETPILPPEVYQKGLSAKEQAQQLPDMDPISVVKTPVYFRKRPPGISAATDYLRSTWVLAHGKWEKIEDKASTFEQDRFDRWVERVCFQYHHINHATPAPQTKPAGSPGGMRRRSPASQARMHDPAKSQRGYPASQASNGSEKNTQRDKCQGQSIQHPRLTMSIAGLYLRETPGEHPITVHAAPPCTARVINTLLRIVHGGSVGWGGLPHGYSDNLYPAENQDPDKNRIAIRGVPKIFRDRPRKPKSRRDKKLEIKRNSADEWVWEDESTLIRVHNEPGRKLFVPKLPCSLKRVRDDRVTIQKFQSNSKPIKDSWRMAGNNIESSNRRNEFWTGKTIFNVIPNVQWGASMVDESDAEDKGSCGDSIVTCTRSENMDIIPLDDMFISHQYKLRHHARESHEWDIKMTLHRKNGKKLVYCFTRSPSDILVAAFKD